MATTNPYERYGRTVKATKLALAIQSAHAEATLAGLLSGVPGSAADLATSLTPELRRAFEAAAGVREASDKTWAEVIRLLTPTPVSEQTERAREARQHNERAVQRWLNGSYSHGA